MYMLSNMKFGISLVTTLFCIPEYVPHGTVRPSPGCRGRQIGVADHRPSAPASSQNPSSDLEALAECPFSIVGVLSLHPANFARASLQRNRPAGPLHSY